MNQSLVWTLSIVLMALVALVFLYFASSSSGPDDGRPKVSGRWRAGIFWTLVIVFVPYTGYTLSLMPYPSERNVDPDPIVVDVDSIQWAWILSRSEFPVGRTIEFHVTSQDVNHGFAIYDEQLRVVTQTQAMPGYTNVLRHTFTEPGAYRVLCLEYCGIAHHGMLADLTVVAAAAEETAGEVSHD